MDEVESTEKTYLGTKIEILLRNRLGFEKGKILDLDINGVEVDIKHSISRGWMIPNEARNRPCILVSEDEKTSLCCFGLVVAHVDSLRGSKNQDSKTSLAAASLKNVHWLLFDAPYPQNFWEKIGKKAIRDLMKITSPIERLASFFKEYRDVPISRDIVLALAPQDDSMKRLRKNGGARDLLSEEGIALLSGNCDRALIQKLELPFCAKGYFISYKPSNPEHISLLRAQKKID